MKYIKKLIAFTAILSIMLSFNSHTIINASDVSEVSSSVSSENVEETTADDKETDTLDEATTEQNESDNGMKTFNIEQLYLNIDVPSDIIIVTRDTPKNDKVFDQLKKPYNKMMDEMKKSNYYLLAYANDFAYQFTIEMHKDEESKDIYDFNLLTEDQLRAVKDSLVNSGLYHSVSRPAHTQAIFFNLGIEYKGDSKTYYAAQSYTVINGMQITITLQTFSGKDLTDEQYKMASEILKSVKFTKVMDKPEIEDNTDQYIIVIAIVALIIGVIVALVIVLTMYRKNTQTLMSMEDKLEEPQKAENEKSFSEIVKSIYRKIFKKKFGYEGEDDEFIYNFDYSYIDNNDTQFDISIDDIYEEIEQRKSKNKEGHSESSDEKNNVTERQKGKKKNKKKSKKNKSPVQSKKDEDLVNKNKQNSSTEKLSSEVTDFDVFSS